MKNAKLILWITLAVAALGPSPVVAGSAKPKKAAKFITLKSPKGGVERIERGAKPGERVQFDHIPNRYASECPTKLGNLDTLETSLELQTLIEALQGQEKPRRLTEEQRALVENTPFCGEFVTDLMVISKLLSGYDLLKVAGD